jgi:5-methylcytosine-specific restriction enzyme A
LKDSIFQIGQVYKRSDIHEKFGGNQRSGIAASASYPFIFIFSGESGQQHGYKDQWLNPNVYSYTGEGQIGDMSFDRGNLAILNHHKNGKRIFLFIHERKAYVRFESELELLEVKNFESLDTLGEKRIAINFFFKRAGSQLEYQTADPDILLLTEPDAAYTNTTYVTESQGLITTRVGQGAYRSKILFRWEYKCAVTNYSSHEILVASHIVPWKESNNYERLDVDNGILLSPNYDALFDRHLISFENNGRIILSGSFAKSDYQKLGVTGKESIKNLSRGNHEYLERHRASL